MLKYANRAVPIRMAYPYRLLTNLMRTFYIYISEIDFQVPFQNMLAKFVIVAHLI